jgi:hypothetical protein
LDLRRDPLRRDGVDLGLRAEEACAATGVLRSTKGADGIIAEGAPTASIAEGAQWHHCRRGTNDITAEGAPMTSLPKGHNDITSEGARMTSLPKGHQRHRCRRGTNDITAEGARMTPLPEGRTGHVVAEARYDLLVVGVQHFAPVAPAADPLYI